MRCLLRLCVGLVAVGFAAPGALGQAAPIALTGTLVMPQEVIKGGTVVVQDGRIVASGKDVKLPVGTKVIATHGIIAPGLIDLHNHLTWNIFPRWKPIEEFGNRYDWQQKPVYNVLLTEPHAAIVKAGLECEAERFAEVRAITQGETSVTGSMQTPCEERVDRDLDFEPSLDAGLGAGHGRVIYDVFPLQMTPERLKEAEDVLAGAPPHSRGALLIHLAEGGPHDAAAAREFEQMKGRGLLRPGVSLIHAVAVKPEGFVEMAANGVGFVWSPRSNIELYGDTANVAAAKAAGVRMALAPDWGATGSDGSLGELNYASVWNAGQTLPPFTERELVMMATANAAALVNLSGEIGSLAAGHAADLMVVSDEGDAGHDAYWVVTHSGPQDVELLMVGGVARYGDPALMQQIGGPQAERVEVCGAVKALDLGGKRFVETENVLAKALRQQGRALAPLAECGY